LQPGFDLLGLRREPAGEQDTSTRTETNPDHRS
jgi:hypothetical protein